MKQYGWHNIPLYRLLMKKIMNSGGIDGLEQ